VDTLYVCGECGEKFLALMLRSDGSTFLAMGRYVKCKDKLRAEGNAEVPHVCGDKR